MTSITVNKYSQFGFTKEAHWGDLLGEMTFSRSQPDRLWFSVGSDMYIYIDGDFPPDGTGVEPVSKYMDAKAYGITIYNNATHWGVSAYFNDTTLRDILSSNTFWELVDKNLPLSATGGSYSDTLIGTSANDEMWGNAGSDIVKVGGGNDIANGGDGDDSVWGGAGHDVLYGDAGKDVLYGESGNDHIQGGPGNDVLVGGSGADALFGDTGFDYASYSNSTRAVSVNLTDSSRNSGDALDDSFNSIEGVIGSKFDDALTGAGASEIFGGGLGNDIIDGRGGYDTVDYGEASQAVRASLNLGTASGAAGVDKLSNVENIKGSAFNDTLTGSAAVNRLLGADGADTIRGYDGPDTLDGGNGNDRLFGGAGSDTLVGGFGGDTFLFDTTPGSAVLNIDQISDFNVTEDIICLDTAIYSHLTGAGTLSESQFYSSSAGYAHDRSDRIIYETDTGALYYDANGSASGGRVQFAQLSANLSLSSDVFFVS